MRLPVGIIVTYLESTCEVDVCFVQIRSNKLMPDGGQWAMYPLLRSSKQQKVVELRKKLFFSDP